MCGYVDTKVLDIWFGGLIYGMGGFFICCRGTV
jgi:hypothetical protein